MKVRVNEYRLESRPQHGSSASINQSVNEDTTDGKTDSNQAATDK